MRAVRVKNGKFSIQIVSSSAKMEYGKQKGSCEWDRGTEDEIEPKHIIRI